MCPSSTQPEDKLLARDLVSLWRVEGAGLNLCRRGSQASQPQGRWEDRQGESDRVGWRVRGEQRKLEAGGKARPPCRTAATAAGQSPASLPAI